MLHRPIFYLSILICSIMIFVLASAASAQSTNTQDERDEYPKILTMSPKGVNLQTGEFVQSETDLSIGPLTFVRSWNGASSYMRDTDGGVDKDTLGVWTHNFGQGVSARAPSSNVIYDVIVGGVTYSFLKYPNNVFGISYQQVGGLEAIGTQLSLVNGNYEFINKSGDIYRFFPHSKLKNYGLAAGSNQLLKKIEYADGRVVDFTYNQNAQLKTIISRSGFGIILDYTEFGSISTVCGFNLSTTYADVNSTCAASALKVSYGYSLAANNIYVLSSVTDVSGNVTTYSYGVGYPRKPQLLQCIKPPGYSVCQIENFYGPQGSEIGTPNVALTKVDQVRKQMTATGDVWLYRYEPALRGGADDPIDPAIFPRPIIDSYAFMTDPQGRETTLRYLTGYIDQTIGPEGTHKYGFNGTRPVSVVYPGGNKDSYSYTDTLLFMGRRSQPYAPSAQSEISTLRVYPPQSYPNPNGTDTQIACVNASPKLCDKPLYAIDERGSQTDYTYDPAHGGVLTETLPAVNGIRPQTRYSYVQRYAWIKDAAGGFVRAATPIWVQARKSICRTSAAVGDGCAAAGDEIVTTYDYGSDAGPNNLLLRGMVETAGGVSLRTCFGYDAQGNRVSETSPRAGLGVCP
jgi:hypothetical protein